MDLRKLTVLATILLVPVSVFAQGSGSAGDERSFATIRSVKGTLAEIDYDKGYVLVSDARGGRHAVKTNQNTKFAADKGTELAELAAAKELTLRHFEKGYLVQLTYRTLDRVATELKLKAR